MFTVSMFLQRRAALIRSGIYVRRLDRFSNDGRDGIGEMVMKETGCIFIVSDVAIALTVSAPEIAKADQLAVVPSQCS